MFHHVWWKLYPYGTPKRKRINTLVGRKASGQISFNSIKFIHMSKHNGYDKNTISAIHDKTFSNRCVFHLYD